ISRVVVIELVVANGRFVPPGRAAPAPSAGDHGGGEPRVTVGGLYVAPLAVQFGDLQMQCGEVLRRSRAAVAALGRLARGITEPAAGPAHQHDGEGCDPRDAHTTPPTRRVFSRRAR